MTFFRIYVIVLNGCSAAAGKGADDIIVPGTAGVFEDNRMTGMTIKQKREVYSHSLDSALEKIVLQLSQIPEVERVILFGSYAAGRRDLFTDLDLLVVMDSELDFVQRTAELYSRIQTDVDLDLLVYTPEELKVNQGSSFIRRALQTGQVIYEKKTT